MKLGTKSPSVNKMKASTRIPFSERSIRPVAIAVTLAASLCMGCAPKAVRGGEGTANPNLDNAAMSITLKVKEPVNEDADGAEYSIQKSKLRTEEDHRQTLAEKKKNQEQEELEINTRTRTRITEQPHKSTSTWRSAWLPLAA